MLEEWFNVSELRNFHDGDDGGDGGYGSDEAGGGDDEGSVGGDGDCDGLKGEWNYANGQKLQFSSETLQ